MSEWQTVAIGEICDLVTSGGTPLTSQKEYYHNGSIPWVKTKEVNQCRLYGTENHITQLGLDNSSAKLIPENSIIIAMYGDGKTAGRVALNKVPVTTNQACCNLILNKQKANYDFVFYNLMGRYDELVSKKTGSGQQNLNGKIIKEIEIDLPPLPEQKAIASVLSSLDDKIDLLHRQNKTLEAMAETLFRQWFIEDTAGKTELITLGEMIEIHDSKRIPLSKLERDKKKNGSIMYPYYGAAKIMDYVDDYIFDGDYLLLGEDGTVQDENGYPILQRANGKFWVNNHSHVLSAKAPYNNFFLWCLLSKTNIEKAVTGAVQPKINQENLRKLDFVKFDESKVLDFNDITSSMLNKLNTNNLQIQTIEKLRDTLLPKLMSGEVRVQYQTEQIA